MKQHKLYSELTPIQRVKENYKENSMLVKFYNWLFKKKPTPKPFVNPTIFFDDVKDVTKKPKT